MAREQGWSWQQIGDAVGVTRPVDPYQVRKGTAVTKRQTEAQGETIYHPWNPWATYIAAREEARRRGDRRVGTEHLLVALLLEPDLASVLGTAVEAAAGLATLDRQALAAVGLGTQIEETVPAPRTRLSRRPTRRRCCRGGCR